MELSQDVREFLNSYGKDYLRKNDFEGMFKRLSNYYFDDITRGDGALEILNLFKTETSINIFDHMDTVPNSTFFDSKKVKPVGAEIDVVGRVSTIGPFAFSGIKGLKKVVIGDSVELIDKSAFADCKDLVSLHLGDSVKVIRNEAFANTGLKHIYLPESVTMIGSKVFPQDCYLISPRRKKKSLKFPKSELNWYREHLVLDPKLNMVAEPSEEESVEEEI